MNPSPPSSCPAAKRSRIRRLKWTPPACILEVAIYDDSLIGELIREFKTATETSLQQMRAALATGDVARLRSAAHKIRGSARQLGADALAEACQTLEFASSLASVSFLGELLDRCQETFAQTESAMTSYAGGAKAANQAATPLS
jgi:HPt (histidine-containing phosphotransfer) domain-containing protein